MAVKQDIYGSVIRQELPERDGLIGMAEITVYAGFSKEVVKRLAAEQGFPLTEIADKYVSARSLVDAWLRQQIMTAKVNMPAENKQSEKSCQ